MRGQKIWGLLEGFLQQIRWDPDAFAVNARTGSVKNLQGFSSLLLDCLHESHDVLYGNIDLHSVGRR